MSFYQEIIPYIDYVHSIRKLEKYLSFDMTFPNKWVLPKSLVEENQIVGFETTNQNLKGISFVSPISENDVSLTLGKIARVIKLNKEKELKEKLFRDTVERLKETFEKTDLDKLKNLQIDFNSDEEETTLNITEDDDEQRDNKDAVSVGERT
jgi:hypothetical protein